MESFIKKYFGALQGEMGQLNSIQLTEISFVCAELFESKGQSFIWEAVRCLSNTKDCDRYLLIKPYDWVVAIIKPWCKHINLALMDSEIINVEFFTFLIETSLLNKDLKGSISDCWNEVVCSEVYGVGNTQVLFDTLIQAYIRVPKYRKECIKYVGQLFSLRQELISSILMHNLSAAGKPWNKSFSAASTKHQSHNTIKSFLKNFESPIEDENDVSIPVNKTVLSFVSHLLLINYEVFIPHIHILLNFVFYHVKNTLQEHIMETNLFESIINGYVGMLHSTGRAQDIGFAKQISTVRKILGWIDLENFTISWDLWERPKILSGTVFDISFDDLLIMLLEMHEIFKSDIFDCFASECLLWAKEGYLV